MLQICYAIQEIPLYHSLTEPYLCRTIPRIWLLKNLGNETCVQPPPPKRMFVKTPGTNRNITLPCAFATATNAASPDSRKTASKSLNSVQQTFVNNVQTARPAISHSVNSVPPTFRNYVQPARSSTSATLKSASPSFINIVQTSRPATSNLVNSVPPTFGNYVQRQHVLQLLRR